MEAFVESLAGLSGSAIGKILFALVLFIVGSIVIKTIMKLLDKSKALSKADQTVVSFTKSCVKIALWMILIVAIVGTLGVEMSSIAAVIASAGVTVGLALQGALSNLAGGIMLLVFKPFKKGEYIEAAGVAGVVQELTVFYTVLLTPDNKRITVPNGSLMNSNIIDYSSEDVRRVDLSFACAKSESPEKVRKIILEAIAGSELVLETPEKPFVNVGGGTNEATQYTVRVWCKSAQYWDTYFDMNNRITIAIGNAGLAAPAVRIING